VKGLGVSDILRTFENGAESVNKIFNLGFQFEFIATEQESSLNSDNITNIYRSV
jgi:hypothetical protein